MVNLTTFWIIYPKSGPSRAVYEKDDVAAYILNDWDGQDLKIRKNEKNIPKIIENHYNEKQSLEKRLDYLRAEITALDKVSKSRPKPQDE